MVHWSMKKMNRDFYKNNSWSVNKIQPIAIEKVYSKVWSDADIIELDNDSRNMLKTILDRSGADKLIKFRNGTIAFLGQRFRRIKNTGNNDDFTLRYWNYKAKHMVEFKKLLAALENDRSLATYYAYGHVNQTETGFVRFRILRFKQFLEYVVNRNFLPDDRIRTNQGDAEFLCWRFSRIPKSLMFFDTEQKQTLDSFFGGR